MLILKRLKIYNSFILLCAILFAQSAFSATNRWSGVFKQDTTSSSVNDILISDSLSGANQDSTAVDSTAKKSKNPFLVDVITGSGQDSMIYDMKSGKLYIYKEGDIAYTNKQLQADYMEMHLKENLIIAKGLYNEETEEVSKANFVDGDTTYELDSITYNVDTEKAKIYDIAFQEGEGTLHGRSIKKMNDGVFNIEGGRYTTCDADHPHFYLALSKAQYVNTESSTKVIFGPATLWIEDVPLPIALPFGFFPMMKDQNSGIIIPTVGEENAKGFFLKDFGYYKVFNDYADLTLKGGVYTYGSWDASVASLYKVRYKFSGNLSVNFAKTIYGVSGSSDYTNMNNYKVAWTHSQDAKFKPGSTFSANVNWSSSNYNKFDADDMQDYVSSQTNSSVSYSKTWAGTPFSLSANIQHSQSNRDSTVMLSMPNFVFNMNKIMPFQRKNAVGAQKWYEKIGVSYTGTFKNSVTTKENELFSSQMFKDMEYGVDHSIPVTTSFNFLKYLNISPSLSYNESWYFSKISKEWDPINKEVIVADTTKGFYRLYDYSISAGTSTQIYGMFGFKGKDPAIRAIRHVLSPSISGSYTPNFGASKFGYYRSVQSSEDGSVSYYSPYEEGIYGVPSMGESAALSFSLGNTLEMKVRSRKDSTGEKKVKLIENLQLSSSYNFLADSMNLSNISASFRTTLFNTLGINVSGTLDPYGLDRNGKRISTFSVEQGKLVRLTNLGFSLGYSFRSAFGSDGGTGSATIPQATPEQQRMFDEQGLTYAEQQRILSQNYYNFSIPWNLSVNYTFSYSKPAFQPNVTQTLSFNGNVNLTDKMGLTFNAGYDFEANEITPGSFSFTRDLHCWQMSFTWVPTGFRKSWNFTIQAKSSMLSDLKYEKSSAYTDNYASYY